MTNKEEKIVSNPVIEYDNYEQSDSLFLYVTSITVGVALFATGIGLTWTSPIIPKLLESGSVFGHPVSALEIGWIATWFFVGAMIAPLVIGNTADIIGRKKSLLMFSLPMLIASFMLAFARNLYLFYIARFMHGFSLGALAANTPMYLGEITENHNRGKFNCLANLFIIIGSLYPLIAGPWLSTQYFSLSCAVPIIIFLIICSVFLPESPHFLIRTSNFSEAEKVLMKLRNQDKDKTAQEILNIQNSLECNKSITNKPGLWELFSIPSLRKTFVITGTLLIIQEFAGSPALRYLEFIFKASGSTLAPGVCSIIVGTFQLFINLALVFIIDRFPRKTLLYISSLGVFLALIFLGGYYFLKDRDVDVSSLWWLPITCLVVEITMFNVGMGPIPWLLMAEIFPNNIKTIASNLSSFTCAFAGALVTFTFPLISEKFGMAVGFWGYACVCVICIVFVYFVVPETKNKTSEEIQRIIRAR